MRRLPPGRLAAGVLGALAVVFCAASWKLGYWVQGAPGPGLLPLGTSLLLAASAALLVRAPPAPDEEAGFAGSSLAAFALLCAYGLVLPWAGMVLPSVVFGVVWMCVLNRRPLAVSMLASVLLAGAGILLFRGLLKVQMPLWPAFS